MKIPWNPEDVFEKTDYFRHLQGKRWTSYNILWTAYKIHNNEWPLLEIIKILRESMQIQTSSFENPWKPKHALWNPIQGVI